MINKIFENILEFIALLDKDTFRKYLIISLIILFGIIAGSLHYINNKSNSLINNINAAQRASLNTNSILKKLQEVESQKEILQKKLNSKKDFDLKGFFESFIRTHKIKPDSPWADNSTPVNENDLLEETSLQALFKGQTMEKLTEVLAAIEEIETIFVKNLKITKEPTNTISFDMIVGTLKYRQSK